MHYKASKSRCLALAPCFSGGCASGTHPKHRRGGLDISGHWAQGWCSSKPDEYTSSKQPLPHLYPITTTADTALTWVSPQCSQSWAPNVNSATVTWLCTLFLPHILKFPTGDSGGAWKFWPFPCPSWADSLPIEYFWSGSFDRNHFPKSLLQDTFFPLPISNLQKKKKPHRTPGIPASGARRDHRRSWDLISTEKINGSPPVPGLCHCSQAKHSQGQLCWHIPS